MMLNTESQVAVLIRSARQDQVLSLQDLAEILDCTPDRLAEIEQTGLCSEEFLVQLTIVLGIAVGDMRAAAEFDDQTRMLDFYRHASEPETPRLICDVGRGMTIVVPVPRTARTTEDREAFASRWACENRRCARLQFADGAAAYISPDGHILARTDPALAPRMSMVVS